MDEPKRRKLVRADLERMNLPDEFWTIKIEGAPESVRSAVARYMWRIDEMVRRGVGLLVYGEVGVGKTGVSCLIAKEARSRGYTVFFCRVWELREMIRARLPFDADMTVSERAREVDVLVLDDLRRDDAEERFIGAAEIEQLIRYRGSKNKVTIITTSLSDDLKVPPMYRIYEATKATMVPFRIEGPNLHELRQKDLKKAVFGG